MKLPRISGAGQWVNCPASFKAQQQFPPKGGDEPTQSVLEGRACHDMAQEILRGDTVAVGVIDPKHGIVRIEEMLEAVKVYTNEVKDYMIEQRIDLSHLQAGWSGICDAYAVTSHDKLHVVDAKFGHSYVEVKENWQLILYALGLVHEYKYEPGAMVHLTIVQPRCFVGESFVRTWELSVEELLQYESRAKTAVQLALAEKPRAKSGSQCKYCSARINCDTFRESVYDCFDYAGKMTVHGVTADQVGIELDMIESMLQHLKAMQTGLEEQAFHSLRNGETVRGYGLTSVNGQPKWRAGVMDTITAIGDLCGVDVIKRDLYTPKQLIKKGLDEVVMMQYTESKSSVKLVKQTAKDFAKLFDK